MTRVQRALFVLVWCADKTLAAAQVAQQASAAAKRQFNRLRAALHGTSR